MSAYTSEMLTSLQYPNIFFKMNQKSTEANWDGTLATKLNYQFHITALHRQILFSFHFYLFTFVGWKLLQSIHAEETQEVLANALVCSQMTSSTFLRVLRHNTHSVHCTRMFVGEKKAMPGRGNRVSSTAKGLISNVYRQFKSQQNKSKVSGSVLKKTMEATGFCRSTVYHVMNEQKQLREKSLNLPVKRYVKSRKSICIDDFDVAAIRRTVREFYDRKEYPTISTIIILYSFL